jgi:hypothetical protein
MMFFVEMMLVKMFPHHCQQILIAFNEDIFNLFSYNLDILGSFI